MKTTLLPALFACTLLTTTAARADAPPLPPPSAPAPAPAQPAPVPTPTPAPPPAPPPSAAASASVVTPTPAQAQGPSSVRASVEWETRAANGEQRDKVVVPRTSIDDAAILHGFRFGYGYIFNYDEPAEGLQNKSLKETVGLRTPHHFLLGYEVVYRVTGHSWLNVLLMGNAMVAGLEQSKVMPTGNLLIGFELKNSFQIGVGASLSPLKGSEAHTIVAAGWTPRIGTIYTPVHFFVVPDVDGNHRMGVTTGVTF